MNKTKKRRKTQRRRRRKQILGGVKYIGQFTDGVIGTFEFEAINVNDLYRNEQFYKDNIRQFKCPFLNNSHIVVMLNSTINTKDYPLDTGTYGYEDGTQENKVFFLYFVEPSGLPLVANTKTMIGFISCSIYRPRNICYVKWECSDASVIKGLVTRADRRVQKASHVLQAFFLNYLDRIGVTAIYKQLHTYDHPDNGPDENRGTLTPRYMIAKYNLDTAFKLFTKRQANDIDNLIFLQLQKDHYSKFDISQFKGVRPIGPGQISEYPTIDNGIDLLKMLDDAKRYETEEVVISEIEGYIDALKEGSYSHIERLMYMRDLCNMVNTDYKVDMNEFTIGKPKPKKKEETVLPSKKAESRPTLKVQTSLRNR
jgi:hypothetical protein